MPNVKNNKFPHNIRFITDLTAKQFFYLKIFGFSCITTFLLVSIFLNGFELFVGIQTLHAATVARENLIQEQRYWEDVLRRHPGYRDVEFQLALISYQLGEKEKAISHVNNALAIDPNFIQGRELAKKLGE